MYSPSGSARAHGASEQLVPNSTQPIASDSRMPPRDCWMQYEPIVNMGGGFPRANTKQRSALAISHGARIEILFSSPGTTVTLLSILLVADNGENRDTDTRYSPGSKPTMTDSPFRLNRSNTEKAPMLRILASVFKASSPLTRHATGAPATESGSMQTSMPPLFLSPMVRVPIWAL